MYRAFTQHPILPGLYHRRFLGTLVPPGRCFPTSSAKGLLFCWLWCFYGQSLLCCHKSVVLSRTVLGNQFRVWKSRLWRANMLSHGRVPCPERCELYTWMPHLIAMCYWGGYPERWGLYAWIPHLLLLCVTEVGVSQASPEEGDGYI